MARIITCEGRKPTSMDVYRKALEWLDEGRKFAFGVVTYAQGSTPQKAGSKALLDSEGSLVGTLGGGLIEAKALERMLEAIGQGDSQLFEFALDEEYSRTAGPICGGVMRFYVDPAPENSGPALRQAIEAVDRREPGALLTLLTSSNEPGARTSWLTLESGSSAPFGIDNADIELVTRSETPAVVTGRGGEQVFVEPFTATPRLLIVGGGHVGQAVAHQGALLGFSVTVYDDREEFVRPELFPPGTSVAHGNFRDLVDSLSIDKGTYIVLVSRGHKPDAEALEGCIHSSPAYLGMIGSERKTRLLRKDFIEEGLATAEEFDRVLAPIGYDIGAVTVPEIAVSIAAQLVAARRRNEAVRAPSTKALR